MTDRYFCTFDRELPSGAVSRIVVGPAVDSVVAAARLLMTSAIEHEIGDRTWWRCKLYFGDPRRRRFTRADVVARGRVSRAIVVWDERGYEPLIEAGRNE